MRSLRITAGTQLTFLATFISLLDVAQLCSSSDAPYAFRVLGYEILWTLTAAVDVVAYRGLVSLARQDMTAADHPDLTLTALATLRSLPAHMCIDIMLGEDADRTMVDAMGGDAPAHIRAASIVTFTRLAMHAWMQVADTRSNGTARPHDNYTARVRMRSVLFDRAVEVLKGASAQCEDRDVEVAGAAFAALRTCLEAGPYAASCTGDAEGSSSVASRLIESGSLLDAACRPVSSLESRGAAETAAAAPLRAAHLRVVRELCRRTSNRLSFYMQRVTSLRPAGRAHAVRTITLLLAFAVVEASGTSGAFDTPAILRMDHAASTADQSLASVVASFVHGTLVPLASRPLGQGGVGGASSSIIEPAGSNLTAAIAELEACRSFVQLTTTFAALPDGYRHRSACGGTAVGDLDEVCGRPGAGSAGTQAARAMAAGALAVDTTNNYILATLADVDQGEYEAFAGPLWPVIGGQPALVHSSAIGAALASVAARHTSSILRSMSGLLRRVQAGGVSSGSLVAVAGASSATSSSAGATDAATGTASTGTATGGPMLWAGDQAQGVTAGNGTLGLGAGSTLMSTGMLQRSLHVLVALCATMDAPTFLAVCPAVIREVGRLPDDVIDDPGSGFDQSSRRVKLLLRLASMATHAALVEHAPQQPLSSFERKLKPGQSAGVHHQEDASSAPSGSGPAYSTLLSRIIHDATRPLTPSFSNEQQGGGSDTGSSSVGNGSQQPSHSACGGNVHAAETAVASTRFRAEVAAVFLQSIARAAPTGAVLAQVAVATAHDRGDPFVQQLCTSRSRVSSASSLHVWLAFALDTTFTCLWLLEHRLTYAGIATMPRDAAAAALAGIMGQPDAPAPSPCPVAFTPPPSASLTGIDLAAGPSRGGDLTVGAAPDVFDPSMAVAMSTAGPSGGVGRVTGWAWAREYEATAESCDALTGLLTTIAALLLPPSTAKTYIPGSQEGGSNALPTALALDLLPPAVLLAHRSGLQRLLHLLSKQDLAVCRMYDLERAAHATAPRMASQAASLAAGISASSTRGSSYDALPSVVPVQLRLLWLLCAAWDGSDGAASTAGVGAAGTSAAMALPRSVSMQRGADGGDGNTTGLHALIQSVTKAERSAAGAGPAPSQHQPGSASGRRESDLYRNTTLSVEALRQKRLSNLAFLLASEAGTALGIGPDLEAAAAHALQHLYGAEEQQYHDGAQQGVSAGAGASASSRPRAGATKSAKVKKEKSAASQLINAIPGARDVKALWKRGTKIGKALGLFGRQAQEKGGQDGGADGGDDGGAWTGEGTVVSHAHFWLLIDMMAQLSASQRCTAGLCKRSVECMLVQPRLAPDVATALHTLLPRLCLFSAAYGRSQVAAELTEMAGAGGNGDDQQVEGAMDASAAAHALRSAVDSTSIFAAVAAHASACSSDPWSFTLYQPMVDDDEDAGHPFPGSPASMMAQLTAFKLADDPASPPATLELLADLHSQQALACIAAASLPELTQNVTLGLNRSSASGARMRTIPPIASAHAQDVASALAMMSMHLSSDGPRSAAVRHPGVCLPVTYLASVPAVTAVGGDSIVLRQQRPPAGPDGSFRDPPLPSGAPRHRDSILLDAALSCHARDPVLACSVAAATTAASATPLRPQYQTSTGRGYDGGLTAEAAVLTSSSDPLTVTMGHTAHPSANRLTLHVSVTNVTHLRIPSGMRVSLQLGGPLTFDRSSVTTAMVASNTSRLGTAGMAGGGMGAASAGSTLSGDFITMQRTSQHHATHILSQPLPPGCTVIWDVVVCGAGFGAASVRTVLQFECIEPLVAVGGGDAPGASIQAMARVGRAVGVGAAEDGCDDADDDVDWSTAGRGDGGVTGHWAIPLLAPVQQATSGDGLIWSGAELNSSVRRGRVLPSIPGTNLQISRTSATRAPSQAGQHHQPHPGLGPHTRSSASMRSIVGASAGSATTPVKQQPGRRPSAQSSVHGGPLDSASEVDVGSTAGGTMQDDDAGSVGSGGDGGGVDMDEEGPGGSTRGHKVRRLEVATQAYKLPATSWLLHPIGVRLPAALAVALACGVDVRPGASISFGSAGQASPLAAAAIDGGGMMPAAAGASASSMSSGSAVSLCNATFASIAARVPYAQYGLAVSQPFIASSADSALPGPSSSFLSMESPSWLAACAVEGTTGSWSRIPLPVSPSITSATAKQVAAAFAEEAGCAANGEQPSISMSGDGVCQAAFIARTWAGSTVVLFITAILTPLQSSYRSDDVAGTVPIQPYIWQVSIQLRTDDARVRAALAVEMPLLVHQVFGGRLSLITHGHTPSPASILHRIDAVVAPDAPPPKAADVLTSSLASNQDATAAVPAPVRYGADSWSGPSIFNVLSVRDDVTFESAHPEGSSPADLDADAADDAAYAV